MDKINALCREMESITGNFPVKIVLGKNVYISLKEELQQYIGKETVIGDLKSFMGIDVEISEKLETIEIRGKYDNFY